MCFNYGIMVYKTLGITDHELFKYENDNGQLNRLLTDNKWVFESNNTDILNKYNKDLEDIIVNKRNKYIKLEEKNKGLIETIKRYSNNNNIKEERKLRLMKGYEDKLNEFTCKVDILRREVNLGKGKGKKENKKMVIDRNSSATESNSIENEFKSKF